VVVPATPTTPSGYFPGYPWPMPPPSPFYPFSTPPTPYPGYGNGPPTAYGSPAAGPWAYPQQPQAPSTPQAGHTVGQHEQIHPQIQAPQMPTPGGVTTHTTSSLDAWCQKHSLGTEVLAGLVKLGFRVGDKGLLEKLDDTVWEWAGLGPLHRMRIMAACDIVE